MILNHKAAIEQLKNEMDLVDFTSYTIFSLLGSMVLQIDKGDP